MSTTFEGYRPRETAYRRITAALFLAGVATFSTIYSTQTVLPQIAATFALDAGTAALTVSVTTICLGLALLFAGPLADAVGRVPIMHTSLVVSGLICLACGFVGDFGQLLVLRAALGVAVAGLPAVAAAYLREEIHAGSATAATALYVGGTALGGMTGRLLTGFVATWFGWRAAVSAVGAMGVACAIAVIVLLPRSRNFAASPLNVMSLNANARRMIEPGLLRLYGIGFCAMGSFVAVFNVLSFRLTGDPFRLSPALLSLLYLTYAFGTGASSFAGRLATRHGSRAVVPGALAIQLAGALVLLIPNLIATAIGVALISVGFFAAHGVTSAWVAARASRRGPGTAQASSFYLFGYYLGSSSLGALAGYLWTHGGWGASVGLSCVALVVGIVLAASMRSVPLIAVPDPTQY